jgi:phosphatidylglycerophosphate synthase
MPVAERIACAASRAGYRRLAVWSPRHERVWHEATRNLRTPVDVVATGDLEAWRRLIAPLHADAHLPVLGPGIATSPDALSRLPRVSAAALWEPGMTATRIGDCQSTSSAFRVRTPCELADSEDRLRASIFKPTDGRLGRFNRRISIPISIWLIRHARLRAHAMSGFVMLLGLYAGWLFSRGTFGAGVAGALLSLAASILDGCDGELARLQYQESALGCWVDTLGDYVYYVAVFVGLTVGAARQSSSPWLWVACGVGLCGGTLVTFALLILLRKYATNGDPERLRVRATEHFQGTQKRWARIVAQLSTVATRATMPYGILGLAVLGLLPVAVLVGAIGAQVYWISLATQFRRLLHVDGKEVLPRSARAHALQ